MHADVGYLTGAYEWAGELATTTGKAVQFSITPTRRAGVWRVNARTLHMVDGKPAGVSVQTSREWPDASYTCLTAMMLQLTMELDRLEGQDVFSSGGA